MASKSADVRTSVERFVQHMWETRLKIAELKSEREELGRQHLRYQSELTPTQILEGQAFARVMSADETNFAERLAEHRRAIRDSKVAGNNIIQIKSKIALNEQTTDMLLSHLRNILWPEADISLSAPVELKGADGNRETT